MNTEFLFCCKSLSNERQRFEYDACRILFNKFAVVFISSNLQIIFYE
jgi:hypothetical protein